MDSYTCGLVSREWAYISFSKNEERVIVALPFLFSQEWLNRLVHFLGEGCNNNILHLHRYDLPNILHGKDLGELTGLSSDAVSDGYLFFSYVFVEETKPAKNAVAAVGS